MVGYILNTPKTYHHYNIMMSILPLVLEDHITLKSLGEFFVDDVDSFHYEEQNTMKIGWKICDLRFLSYSERQLIFTTKYLHYSDNVDLTSRNYIIGQLNSKIEFDSAHCLGDG